MQGKYILNLLRLAMGWLLFWAFLDKLWGLGFNTAPENAWLNGNSPTAGFLKFATKGPFSEIFQSLAGNVLVDWLFMLGLFLIGLALLLGVGVRMAGYGGAVMMILMYLAGSIWPEHNPFLDEHVIYALVFISLARSDAGDWLGLGKWWKNTLLVQRFPFLR